MTPADPDPIRGAARGSAPVPLSVLDLAGVGSGQTAGEALEATTELARLAEARGFHRLWVAEHHSMAAVASSSPAVLIAHLAAHTTSLRIGSGGVMLPNHPPLVVAEQFGTLEALHPGRIDLGIGRAPGTDPATAAALRRHPDTLSADDFPEALAELEAFLEDAVPQGHRYARIHAYPNPSSRPPVWLLGSSGYSAQLAGTLGLPFSFAHHFSSRNTLPALELYREAFRPSEWLEKPYAMVAAGTVCAETDAEARALALAGALHMLRLRTGRADGRLLPTPEEAAAYEFSDAEREFVDAWLADYEVGAPETVRKGLLALQERTGADELMLTAQIAGRERKLRSFELIADAFGLPRA
ncbi:alkanal monooxygenase [Mangrovactinospora gilvigrisea]|uniref:Alkanal monooxygenase n=1 Tax=Mangrovactinospora gilvigrisea TaxID=1428644 RepID=A0A1J7BI19_9ACTN|nr:LLM class flavin-dependent oxidoreductase [Mangrovactinospora gilvigrisea]OIV38319.1 alkanal monooxygenase [Mangrovactinospora gilvigrisea]